MRYPQPSTPAAAPATVTLPTRNLRSQAQPQNTAASVASQINMEVLRAMNEEEIAGGGYPPLPPTDFTDATSANSATRKPMRERPDFHARLKHGTSGHQGNDRLR